MDSEGGRLKGTRFSVGSGSPYAYGVLDSGYVLHLLSFSNVLHIASFSLVCYPTQVLGCAFLSYFILVLGAAKVLYLLFPLEKFNHPIIC